jgi:osmotically-inducible protein OsmY
MRQRIAVLVVATGTALAVACGQTDPGITTAVKSKLAQDDTVKAYQIDVDTSDRVVTLSGVVETAAAKEQAVMLARQTEGVRDIVDQITVSPEAAATTGDSRDETTEATQEARDAGARAGREIQEETRQAGEATERTAGDARARAGEAADRTQAAVTDAGITSAVKAKLLADTAVSGLKIDVDTNAGVVTLTGMATTRAEADRAATLARETSGVDRVINNIKVGR